MVTPLNPEKSTALLGDLVSLALNQSDRSGLSAILKSIAQAVNAYGCVFWEVAPGSPLQADPPRGRLFVLDQWLEDGLIYAFNDLPPHSAAGYTVLTQKVLNVRDVSTDPHVSRDPRYLHRLGVKALVSVPIIFPDSSRSGAITVYRRSSKPFTEGEVRIVEQLSLLVPALYQTIRVKLIFSLTRRVDDILSRTKLVTHDKELPSKLVKAQVQRALGKVCMLVANAFTCIETSVFLEDPSKTSGDFELTATTWPEPVKRSVYRKYEKGLTSWVLAHGKPIKIFDLANFERDKLAIRREYRGLVWTDSLDIKSAVRRFLALAPADDLPPLSFMAAPIVTTGKVLGVIRCCTAKKGPYYLAEADLNLLELIAGRVSQYWSDCLTELETQEENKTWQLLSKSIGELNKFALAKLSDERPLESEIFDEALRVTHSVIQDAEIMDVRMLHKETSELRFVATRGRAWMQGSLKDIQAKKDYRFDVNETPPTSAGAHVFQGGQVYAISDVSEDPYYSEKLVFPGVTRMVIAPIMVGEVTYGVLDIRGIGDHEFPKNAVAIAELLGRQLGLYHYIAETVDQLRKAKADLADEVKEKIQTLEDLAHQLKSPIIQAQARIESAVRDDASGDRSLLAIRGLTRKAKRVAMGTMIFASLARNKRIEPKLAKLERETAVRLLVEATSDNELMIDPGRRVRMRLNREGLIYLESNLVEVDHDLLEQALNNILDNAAKYSFNNSEIDIFAGLTTRTNRFHISVANIGLHIKPADIPEAVKRGWRGGLATLVTGEGSGIGLWLVNSIMEAHGGELRIIPTTQSNRTEIKLIFRRSEHEVR
jgi:GAF domain-containing protein